MRLPYTSATPSFKTAEESQILDRTAGTMIAIRTKNSLPPDVREMTFCRAAALTGAWYEWDIHSPIGLEAGIGDDVMKLLKEGKSLGEGPGSLDKRQRAVVEYTDAMTLSGKVPKAVFEAVRAHFNEKEMVELTASIAGFNTVSRFVVALDVGEKNV
ncbi:hypothetical protein NA57DRAFT_69747 [Rhizodiscina lignyota]|uniref:Carboxymuconolactone decarboxylase-like domain-containing protein n=1 Tax=Rhizodiscina lignyota TaxID=1504668 RepID=A0A9P4I687_9PEZI|nr:hypothetical protein NA57DRAFT_69747 [Rhizodiscina lignyota]